MWIFTSDRDLGDNEAYYNITANAWAVLPNGAHIWYASPEFLKSLNIRMIIQEVKPDSVYLNSMFSPLFSLLPLWILRSIKFSGRIVLAPRGMLNSSAISRKKWKKKIFLSLFALTRISKEIVFHATCNQEEKDIKKYFSSNAHVELIEEIPNVYGKWNARSKQPGQLNCIFISRIHSIKNLLFAIDVVKQVTGCSIYFDVYGPVEDEKYYQKCKVAASQCNSNVRVSFKGPIANTEIFNILQNYHVFFLPTQGENFGHIIFEALTAGCIVLISDKTPWKELQEKNAGWALTLSDKKKFSDKLRQLCSMNKEVFNEKSRAAFQYAQDYLTSRDLKSRYLSLFLTNE